MTIKKEWEQVNHHIKRLKRPQQEVVVLPEVIKDDNKEEAKPKKSKKP